MQKPPERLRSRTVFAICGKAGALLFPSDLEEITDSYGNVAISAVRRLVFNFVSHIRQAQVVLGFGKYTPKLITLTDV